MIEATAMATRVVVVAIASWGHGQEWRWTYSHLAIERRNNSDGCLIGIVGVCTPPHTRSTCKLASPAQPKPRPLLPESPVRFISAKHADRQASRKRARAFLALNVNISVYKRPATITFTPFSITRVVPSLKQPILASCFHLYFHVA